jgi:uncharacterized peroxidase-related enzyme
MTRISPIDHGTAEGRTRELLDAVRTQLGFAPNMMKTMARSPAVLEAYLTLNATLGKVLDPKLREQIALVTAEENACGYCGAAHTALGRMAGLSDDEMLLARAGKAAEPASDAALRFAKAVLKKHGNVGDHDVEAAKQAGISEAEIAQIVAHVALNVFTNYFNLTARTEIDFPKIVVPIGKFANA